jgi:glutamate--cysteine ligase
MEDLIMNSSLTGMLRLFSKDKESRLLKGGNFGLELESQRVDADGKLALTPHPAAFGDKRANPTITTDFSESQIEMITPAFRSPEEVYESLESIRREVVDGIGDELLWPLSMPPRLPAEELIPIARFGDTTDGKQKETYRNGLALRYGKKMQMISGIHYNYSFSDEMIDFLYDRLGKGKERRAFTDELYFSLARNFLRHRWLLIYLFGASPVCDPTYDPVIQKELAVIRKCCPCCRDHMGDYIRYATSLRVSRFGYANTAKGGFNVFYNSLDEYAKKLERMTGTSVLQNESEFYSSIRPKQNIGKGETQLNALKERGVKYVEVRILDIDPFEPAGTSLQQLRFLQVFLLYCALERSRRISGFELAGINTNHHMTALFGRKPDLLLHNVNGKKIPLKELGGRIFEKLRAVAALMDGEDGGETYLRCVEQEQRKLYDIALLPSSKIVKEMKKNGESFLNFGIRHASKGVFENEYNRLQRA